MKQGKVIISPDLLNKKLCGIVHGERVDKVRDLTIENFEKIDFIGISVNVKKKKKLFYHALGKVGERLYFLIFE